MKERVDEFGSDGSDIFIFHNENHGRDEVKHVLFTHAYAVHPAILY